MLRTDPCEERALQGTSIQGKKRKSGVGTKLEPQESRSLKMTGPSSSSHKEAKQGISARRAVKKRVCLERRNVVALLVIDSVTALLWGGPEWADYPLGEEEHQQRAGEPVWPLPRKIQGLLQGQRFAVAASRKGRPPPSRLLRHPLPGRKWRERWGEDVGCRRVALAPCEKHAAQKSWRKEVPPKSRLPLPRTVAYGIAVRMLSIQLRPMSFACPHVVRHLRRSR